MRSLARADILRLASYMFASLPCLPPLPSAATIPRFSLVGRRQPDVVVLPLYLCGGAYCTEFRVDGERFRAVADTGSPFLLVLAKGNCAGGPERWGCFEDLRFGGLDDESVEGFGGQNMDVVWRRGSVRLSTIDSNRRYASPWMLQAALADRRNGARSGAWTVPREGTDLLFEPINFGVVKSVERTGGSSALYLGLARDRNPRANVRPTFLEQTDVEALAFDFPQRTLTLARRPLIKGDGIPLLDLRPLGAPVAQYAAAVHRLLVNGQEIKISRPCVAIIDTGTSGLVVSDTLYDSDELPMPGAAMRTVEVELLSERGEVQTLQAARRPAPLESQAVDAPPVVDRFPLIVTPVHLNWFDEPRRRTLGPLGLPPAEAAAASDLISPPISTSSSPSSSPHVLFVGLAFLSERKLTIDIGQMRLRFDA